MKTIQNQLTFWPDPSKYRRNHREIQGDICKKHQNKSKMEAETKSDQ